MQESAVKGMSTAEIIRRTIDNLTDLVDSQILLAGLEVREGLSSAFKGIGILIIGVVSLFLMAVALMITAILALSLLMPGWLAALIFAVLFLIVGVTLIFIGRSNLRIRPMGRTRDTLGEDLEWLKRRLKSNAT